MSIEVSRKKADVISQGVFLIILGVLAYYNWWWPGILIAIWGAFATKQLLLKRSQDFLLTTILLLSLFIVVYFQFTWNMFMPILFVMAGSYLIIREFFIRNDDPENYNKDTLQEPPKDE